MDRGKGFFRGERVVGGDDGRGQQSFRIGEMIGGWVVVEASLGPMYQCASVGLLLKIINQHVSACDVMDMGQFD